MKIFLSAFVVSLICMLVMDFVWIGLIASNFYKVEMGAYYSSHPLLWPAALFYIIYIIGLVHFVIKPSLEKSHALNSTTKASTSRDWVSVAVNGALFALAAFATYDLTNLSIVPHWPVALSFVDMAWGTVEGSIVATFTYLILRKLVLRNS